VYKKCKKNVKKKKILQKTGGIAGKTPFRAVRTLSESPRAAFPDAFPPQ
jgi:hypothetical protein